MSNDYFNLTNVVTRLTAAQASAINGLAAAIKAAFDKLPAAALISSDRVTFAPATGTANAVQISLPLIAAYTEGMSIRFKVAVTNTGPTTIQINALGARAIRRATGANLAAGDLLAGSIHEVAFNGSFFELLTAVQADVADANQSATQAAASALVATNAASDASAAAASASSSAGSAASAAASAITAAIGNTVQAFSAVLQGIAGQTYANNEAPYRGASAWQKFTITAFGRSLVDDGDAATARSTLGLGALATRNTVSAVQIDPVAVGTTQLADGSVTTGKLAGNERMNVTNILNNLAVAQAGWIGTYGLLRKDFGAPEDPGTVVAGSNLQWTNANGNGGGSPGGTWLQLGRTQAGTSQERSTLYLRIA